MRETAGFLGDRLKLGEVVEDGGAGGIHYIRNSGVLEHRDPQSWKWDLILAILKWPPEALRKLEDSNCKIFLKKVTDFYLPSTNMFSRPTSPPPYLSVSRQPGSCTSVTRVKQGAGNELKELTCRAAERTTTTWSMRRG